MRGCLKIALVTVLSVALPISSSANAVSDFNFSGAPTWGETPDDSAVYVCIPNVRNGLNLIVSYPLGPTQTTAMWGPADGPRPAGFIGSSTDFTIQHPYSATEIRFDLHFTDVACSTEANLPAPGPQFEFVGTGKSSGLRLLQYGYDCETLASYVRFQGFVAPGDLGSEPNSTATFEGTDWGEDNCDYDFDGNFPDLEYYQQRAAEMEESSALPNTV